MKGMGFEPEIREVAACENVKKEETYAFTCIQCICIPEFTAIP